MSREEIIAMAKEAGFGMQMALLDHPYCQADAQRLYQQLERFAALVAAKEREACAQVCDAEAERALFNWRNDLPSNQKFWNGAEQLASVCAAAIRARSTE